MAFRLKKKGALGMICCARLFFISLIACQTVIFYSCDNSPEGSQPDGITTTFEVKGLNCAHKCGNELRGALLVNPQIYSVDIDFVSKDSSKVIVVHDKKFSVEDVKKAIDATKFRVLKQVP